MGIMRQFVGQVRDESTVKDLLLSTAAPELAAAAAKVSACEAKMLVSDDEKVHMRYAEAIIAWGDAGGYELETTWDKVCMAALGIPFDKAEERLARTLSGGEQKRLVLEALLKATTICYSSTSLTTTSMYRANAGLRQ